MIDRMDLDKAMAQFASENGVEELLDLLAGYHLAYTERSPLGSPSRAAYDLLGIDLGSLPTLLETH